MDDEPPTSSQLDYQKKVIQRRCISFYTSYEADFPKQGVINRCGYLFHHFLPFSLTSEHILRLHEYGITYKKHEKIWSKDEDDRIRKNWRKFAEKHGFQYEDARLYVGFLALDGLTAKKTRLQNDSLVKLGLFPRLCRKLENRSAKQIQMRMFYIFDPHYTGQPDPIPLDTTLETTMRVKEGEHIVDLALEYRLPYLRLKRALARTKKRAREIGCTLEELAYNPTILDDLIVPVKDRRRFYHLVLRCLNRDDYWIRTTIMECRKTWKRVINKEMGQLDWSRIVSNFRSQNEKSIKRNWWSLLKELRGEYHTELDANFIGNEDAVTDESKEMAWITAKNKLLPPPLKTLAAIRKFLKALSKCVTNEEQGLRSELVNKERLKKKLINHGLISDEDYKLTECQLYKCVRGNLRIWNRSFFRFIEFPLGVKDKVSIAKRCYNRLYDFHGDRNPDISDALPRVTKGLLVESTILYMHKLSEGEWSPPAFLRKYVKSSELLDYFRPSTSSGIRGEEKELRIFRKSVFSDETCLRVPALNKVSKKAWQVFQGQPESNAEVEIWYPSKKTCEPRGWHPQVLRKRKIPVIDYSKCGPSYKDEETRTKVMDLIDIERNQRLPTIDEEFDNTVATTPEDENRVDKSAVISEKKSPKRKRKREGSPDLFASSSDDLLEEEEDFSHLRINASQKSTERARSPMDLTFASVFG